MEWVALVLAIGAWAFAWWRTRPEAEANQGGGETAMGRAMQAVDQAEYALGELAVVRQRLDALEEREPVDVSGLRERVGRLEAWSEGTANALQEFSEHLEEWDERRREDETAFRKANWVVTRTMIAHVWSTSPATLEGEPEDDYSEGGCVVYHHDGEGDWAAVVEAARADYHDVSHSPELRLLAVHFTDPESAPEVIAGADRVYTRRRLGRTKVGQSHWVGDHVDWRNETGDPEG